MAKRPKTSLVVFLERGTHQHVRFSIDKNQGMP